MRELYEMQVEEEKESDTQITATTHKASIEDSHWAIFLADTVMKWSSIESITDMQLWQRVSDKCTRKLDGEHVHLINDVVWKVTMPMHVPEAEDRWWSLHKDYVQALKANGYVSIPRNKMHLSIAHLMSKVKPLQLNTHM